MLTLPPQKPITPQAERRLKVLQSLDTLGAGFQLASHDLDIRGAGNLLGDEQSGHIKEVGYELYQQMLEEAVAQLKAGITEPTEDQWSPSIAVGAPVMIPESYIADLQLRLGLYRRLSTLETDAEIDAFASILADHHLTVSVRKSRGRDIRAACGQLIVEGLKRSPAQVLADRMG